MDDFVTEDMPVVPVFDVNLSLDTVFSHPRLRELAKVAEDKILADVAEVQDADRGRRLGDALVHNSRSRSTIVLYSRIRGSP